MTQSTDSRNGEFGVCVEHANKWAIGPQGLCGECFLTAYESDPRCVCTDPCVYSDDGRRVCFTCGRPEAADRP